jgi:hypothetical protein
MERLATIKCAIKYNFSQGGGVLKIALIFSFRKWQGQIQVWAYPCFCSDNSTLFIYSYQRALLYLLDAGVFWFESLL